MTDETKPPSRKPFGERDEQDRSRPFGSRVFGEPRPAGSPRRPEPEPRDDLPDDSTLDDNTISVPLIRVPAADVPDDEDTEPGDAWLFDDEDEAVDAVPVAPDRPGTPALLRLRDRQTAPDDDDSGETEPEPAVQVKQRPARQVSSVSALAIDPGELTLSIGVIMRAMLAIVLVSGLVATMFTWWTPDSFLSPGSMGQLAVAMATQANPAGMMPVQESTSEAVTATATPVPVATLSADTGAVGNRIGIVSGHRGNYPDTGLPDPGAICADGLTEAAVNQNVAALVVDWLSQYGYVVDLLDEFDPRLDGYDGMALVSIHADSCEYINDLATGFKVASFADSQNPEDDQKLYDCLVARYAETTGLSLHPSVTYDMTQYHNFREVRPGMPGAIIEIGFMYLDRELLTENPEVVALGVARGVLCYLRDELINPETPAQP